MAGLFSDPQQLLQFLAQPGANLPGAGPVQGPDNMGAVQQLLQNPRLAQAVRAITQTAGRPVDMVQALRNGTAPISNAVAPFEAAMQSVDGLVGKYGPNTAGLRDMLIQAGQAAKNSNMAATVQQLAGSGQAALPSGQQLALGMGQFGPQTMANTAIPMGPGSPRPAIPMGPGVIQQARGAAQQLGNGARAIGSQAMGMAGNVLGNIKNAQLAQLAQKAQASGQLLPAVSGATLAGIPLPAVLSNPATGPAALLTALGAAAIGGGAYTGQKLADWTNARRDAAAEAQMIADAQAQGQARGVFEQLGLGAVNRIAAPAQAIAPGTDVTTPTEEVTTNPVVTSTNRLTSPRVAAPLPQEVQAPAQPVNQIQAPVPSPAAEALSADSPNSYGYESVLSDPSFSAEAMLTQPQAATEEKGGFLSGLGGILKELAPTLIEGLVMSQLDKPQGGVKDWLTGLTFGASDPTQSLAYQSFVANQNERAARRQKEFDMGLTLQNELVKKEADAQIALDKAAYDFEINTVKNAQGVAMDLLKNNSINWAAIQQLPNANEIVAGMMSSDPAVVNASVQAILQTNPDVENQLKQQGYAVWESLKDVTDPDERAQIMNDPQVQGVLGAIGMGPDLTEIYKQDEQNKRTMQTLQQQAALTYLREGGAETRSKRSANSSAATRSLAEQRFEFEKQKYAYELANGKPYTQKAPGSATTASTAPKLKTATFPQGKVTGMFDKNGIPVGEVVFEPTIGGTSLLDEPRLTDLNGLIEQGVIPNIQVPQQPQTLPVAPSTSTTGPVLKIITDPSQLGK